MNERKYDIEERLIQFAVEIIRSTEKLPNTKAAIYLGGQLLRSGVSPCLNYGEARSAESKNDFLHKMKVCLKELRESYNCLRILQRSKVSSLDAELQLLIKECNELISIFVRSIETATKRK
jgi:four helix bundle protein